MMDRPTKFLSHYGVKGMTWENRRAQVNEQRIEDLTNAPKNQAVLDKLIGAAKGIHDDSTKYTVDQLTTAMDDANKKIDEDPSFENILSAAIIQNKFRSQQPDAYEEYRKNQFLQGIIKSMKKGK